MNIFTEHIVFDISSFLEYHELVAFITSFKNNYGHFIKQYDFDDESINRKKVRCVINVTNTDSIAEIYPNVNRMRLKDNTKIYANQLPPKLHTLIVGKKSYLYFFGVMPASLQSLIIESDSTVHLYTNYNRQLKHIVCHAKSFFSVWHRLDAHKRKLPKTVKKITNIDGMYRTIYNSNVEHIEHHPLTNEPNMDYPETVHTLVYNCRLYNTIDFLPDGIRNLSLPYKYNIPITKLPKSLVNFSLGSDYIGNLPPIPNTCKRIDFTYSVLHSYEVSLRDLVNMYKNYLYVRQLRKQYPHITITTSYDPALFKYITERLRNLIIGFAIGVAGGYVINRNLGYVAGRTWSYVKSFIYA